MKKCIRLSAALLALLMLTSVLSACAEGTAAETQTDSVSDIGEIETADPRQTLDVPEADYNNYNFSAMTIDADGLYTMFDVPAMTGNHVEDAIYERNRILEDKFKVRFSSVQDSYDNTMSMMSKQVKSGITGDAAYDLIMQICRNAYALTLQGILCDYNRLEYVDTNKEYYFDRVNSQFTIGNRTFFAYGADSLNVLTQANCLLFNKRIADEKKLPDFYELVNNMAWTYDDMIKACTDAAEDKNGDGKMTLGKNDILGLIGRGDYSIPNSWIAAGEMLIKKDEDDMPVYAAVSNERMVTAMQKMLEFMGTSVCDVAGGITLTLEFTKGHAFMMGAGVMHLEDAKEMDDDYGVLPYPMYDKAQNQYCSRLIDGWLNCVPANCEDPARTSVIMQALAYYSFRTCYDAYYQLGVQAKWLRDPQSVDMVKIILGTLVVDLGDTVWYSSMRSSMTGQLSGAGAAGKVTSILKRMENIAKGQIRSVTKFIDANPG